MRLAADPETCAYAREVFHLIITLQPAVDSSDLRPARKRFGLSLTEVADALDCAISKISLIERGAIGDTRFLRRYQPWRGKNQPHQIAV